MGEIPRGLREKAVSLKEKLLKEWHVPDESAGGQIIQDYIDNSLEISVLKLARQKGEKINLLDLQKLYKIQEGLIRSMNRLKKTPEEIQAEAEKEAGEKAAKDASKTGEDLNPMSPHFDIHKTIKSMTRADWDRLILAEKGHYGGSGKKWAENCRKVHNLIQKFSRAISENAPTKSARQARELKIKKGLPIPEFNVAPEDLPRD